MCVQGNAAQQLASATASFGTIVQPALSLQMAPQVAAQIASQMSSGQLGGEARPQPQLPPPAIAEVWDPSLSCGMPLGLRSDQALLTAARLVLLQALRLVS
jgi:hypothetical protein